MRSREEGGTDIAHCLSTGQDGLLPYYTYGGGGRRREEGGEGGGGMRGRGGGIGCVL